MLFLDIDGVLNSARTCVACKGYPMELDGYHRAMFDEVALGLIRGLCAKGGVSVVVSSAWRITYHWDAIGRAIIKTDSLEVRAAYAAIAKATGAQA